MWARGSEVQGVRGGCAITHFRSFTAILTRHPTTSPSLPPEALLLTHGGVGVGGYSQEASSHGGENPLGPCWHVSGSRGGRGNKPLTLQTRGWAGGRQRRALRPPPRGPHSRLSAGHLAGRSLSTRLPPEPPMAPHDTAPKLPSLRPTPEAWPGPPPPAQAAPPMLAPPTQRQLPSAPHGAGV